ncbi:phenylalanine--tRNA ligase subunit beta [Opitutus sp. GAS368]|uniref:phenylalanine--tRNA ligase subunit beta n=1 Tax=Opitutus sp. GAS368 TaxID=1882749 RepID=UPI00087DECF3|nr:phenylalanine--tRNA ligase subunit beta [Opitutus sp. GAS368]SDS34235.1 phenylalanyl-tRNA synthetase beta subunit [Opitutus sp. GAS368]
MKISRNWLRQYVRLYATTDELQRAITFLGFEVEGVHATGLPPLEQVVVGEIKTRAKHPNADKLSVCTVDVGPAHGGVRTIVCGAPNCDVGNRVPVALPGAVLPGDFKIKSSKIRGQQSDGMMCAADELGLGGDHAGLLILPATAPIGQRINETMPDGDTVFDIEVTPNRPDALCHIGMARELAAWLRNELQFPAIKFDGQPAGAPRPDILKHIRVDAPEDCPLYVGIAVTGVKVGPSPAWMQERLAAVGLRPINNLVDVGNYVMLELGQPLHVFDAKKIAGRSIVVRRATDGEKLVTLDGKERTLNSRMLVIADEAKPLVVAGIMGGHDAGVDATTTDIILEAAYFRPQSIRWTSKRLGLASDSSYRFERGVDPHGTVEAARRAIDLILETAGGTVVGPSFQVGGDRPWSREIKVTPDYIRAKVGFDITDDEMRDAFHGLHLPIKHEEDTKTGLEWTVGIPSYRGDLDRPIDLVEEVLRIYGTDRIPPQVSAGPALVDGDDDPIAVFNRKATDYLVGQHFHEVVNYTLRSKQELATWASAAAVEELGLANPFVDDQSHLRPTLILGIMESLRLNQSRGVAAARLFETGRVFMELNGTVQECVAVGFVLGHNPKDRAWLARPEPDFYAVKRHLEILAQSAGLDLAAQELVPVRGAFWGWQEGQSAAAGEMKDGWTARFGLLNLAMVRAAGIEGKVWAGMLAFLPTKLTTIAGHRRYQPFSLFPAALRDLALVVDAARHADEVRVILLKAACAATAGAAFTIESVVVFDVYQGKGLPEGKKSLAFALSFRSAERTLTDDEVNAVFAKIQQAVAAAGSVTVRA